MGNHFKRNLVSVLQLVTLQDPPQSLQNQSLRLKTLGVVFRCEWVSDRGLLKDFTKTFSAVGPFSDKHFVSRVHEFSARSGVDLAGLPEGGVIHDFVQQLLE